MIPFIEVFIVGLVAAMSPGPDFVLVMKNSMKGGKAGGLFTALGVGSALVIHVSYSVLGLAFIIQKSQPLFYSIQAVGAFYLLYLGFKAVYHGLYSQDSSSDLFVSPIVLGTTKIQSFWEGFVCNLMNPKAALFFLSVFSGFLHPKDPTWIKWLFGFEIVFAATLWFVLLAHFISSSSFRKVYHHWGLKIEFLLGLILLYFGGTMTFRVLTWIFT